MFDFRGVHQYFDRRMRAIPLLQFAGQCGESIPSREFDLIQAPAHCQRHRLSHPCKHGSVKMLIFLQGPAISGLDGQAHLWGDRLVVFVNKMKKDGRH